MATKRGWCEACGEKSLIVSMSHGVNLCSTCKTVHAHVNNRPETVIGAIKRLDLVDRYVGDLAAEGVAATVDSQVMERIAAAVGYEGTDGDGLITEVEAMASSRQRVITAYRLDEDLLEEISDMVGVGAADMDDIPDEARRLSLHDKILQMVEEADIVRMVRIDPSPDVIRALGLPEGPTSWQTIELAAMQTAAMLEDDKRFAAKLSQRVLESFEVVEASAVTECVPVFSEAQKPNGKAMESYILDLALMALRGEVTGLDPEFLSAMREAA